MIYNIVKTSHGFIKHYRAAKSRGCNGNNNSPNESQPEQMVRGILHLTSLLPSFVRLFALRKTFSRATVSATCDDIASTSRNLYALVRRWRQSRASIRFLECCEHACEMLAHFLAQENALFLLILFDAILTLETRSSRESLVRRKSRRKSATRVMRHGNLLIT